MFSNQKYTARQFTGTYLVHSYQTSYYSTSYYCSDTKLFKVVSGEGDRAAPQEDLVKLSVFIDIAP